MMMMENRYLWYVGDYQFGKSTKDTKNHPVNKIKGGQ